MAVDQDVLNRLSAQREAGITETSRSKAMLGGAMSGGVGLVGAGLAMAAAPATGGASLIPALYAIVGGVAASSAMEGAKRYFAADNPFLRSVVESEEKYPYTAMMGNAVPELPLIAVSGARMATEAGLKKLTGKYTNRAIGEAIAKEVGAGAAVGAGVSATMQAGISLATTGEIHVDPFQVLGDAILAGAGTRSLLPPGEKAALELQHRALYDQIPKAIREERELRRFGRVLGGGAVESGVINQKAVLAMGELTDATPEPFGKAPKKGEEDTRPLRKQILLRGEDAEMIAREMAAAVGAKTKDFRFEGTPRGVLVSMNEKAVLDPNDYLGLGSRHLNDEVVRKAWRVEQSRQVDVGDKVFVPAWKHGGVIDKIDDATDMATVTYKDFKGVKTETFPLAGLRAAEDGITPVTTSIAHTLKKHELPGAGLKDKAFEEYSAGTMRAVTQDETDNLRFGQLREYVADARKNAPIKVLDKFFRKNKITDEATKDALYALKLAKDKLLPPSLRRWTEKNVMADTVSGLDERFKTLEAKHGFRQTSSETKPSITAKVTADELDKAAKRTDIEDLLLEWWDDATPVSDDLRSRGVRSKEYKDPPSHIDDLSRAKQREFVLWLREKESKPATRAQAPIESTLTDTDRVVSNALLGREAERARLRRPPAIEADYKTTLAAAGVGEPRVVGAKAPEDLKGRLAETEATLNSPHMKLFPATVQRYFAKAAAAKTKTNTAWQKWTQNPTKMAHMREYLSQWFYDKTMDLQTAWIDRQYGIDVVADMLEKLSGRSGGLEPGDLRNTLRLVQGRQMDKESRVTTELRQIGMAVGATDRHLLNEYALLLRNKDRLVLQAGRKQPGKLAPVAIEGMRMDDVDASLDILRSQYPEAMPRIEQAYKAMRRLLGDTEWQDANGRTTKGALRIAKETGLLTEAEVQNLLRDHPNYTPTELERYVDRLTGGEYHKPHKGKPASVLQEMDAELTGIGPQHADVLQSVERYMLKLIREGEQNGMKTEFLKFRNAAYGKGGEVLIQAAGRKETRPPAGMAEMRVRQDGSYKRWWVPADMAKALDYMEPAELSVVMKIAATPARWIRDLSVVKSWPFALRNTLRDPMNAILYMDSIHPGKFIKAIGQALPEVINEANIKYYESRGLTAPGKKKLSPDLDAMNVLGASHARQVDENALLAAKNDRLYDYRLAQKAGATKKACDLAKAVMEYPSEVSERVFRLAIFKMQRAIGKSDISAAATARGVMDYGIMGQQGRYVNMAVPFFNARLRGAANFATLAKRAFKDPEKYGQAFMIKVGMVGLVPTLAGAALAKVTGQFDSWLNVDPEQAEANFLFPVGKPIVDSMGREHPIFFRIPKPDYLLPILNTFEGILRGAGKAGDGTEQSAVGVALKTFINAIEPITPFDVVDRSESTLTNIAGTIFSGFGPLVTTIAEQYANTRFFTGAPIVPEGLKGLPPELISYPHTPQVYKDLAKVSGIPALRLQTLVEGFGSVPKDVANIVSMIMPQSMEDAALKEDKKIIGLTNNLFTRGFFTIGRANVFDPKSQKALEQLDDAAKLQRYQRNTKLAIAEKQWEAGNRADLQALTRSNDESTASAARERIQSLQLGLDREERTLKEKSVLQRATYIAMKMHESPVPQQYLQEMRRKKIATPEVAERVTQIFRNTRSPQEAVAFALLVAKGGEK